MDDPQQRVYRSASQTMIMMSDIYLFLEPIIFIGEGEYNVNVLKEIKVSESYLGLDQDVRECQNEESLYNCTTREYLDALMEKCGCLPITIRISNEVLLL